MGLSLVFLNEHLKFRKVVSPSKPQEMTNEDRRKRVEDCHENLKLFQEDKWQLLDVELFVESYFFKGKSAASRKTLPGLVKVNMLNQWFIAANLSQKSWLAFSLNQQGYSIFIRKRRDYKYSKLF